MIGVYIFIRSVSEATFENDGNLEALLNHVLWEQTTSNSPTTQEEKVVPYFDESSSHVNVTVQIGANVDLHCKVNHLNDKTVSSGQREGKTYLLINLYHSVTITILYKRGEKCISRASF